jgi:hypothetical protein
MNVPQSSFLFLLLSSSIRQTRGEISSLLQPTTSEPAIRRICFLYSRLGSSPAQVPETGLLAFLAHATDSSTCIWLWDGGHPEANNKR